MTRPWSTPTWEATCLRYVARARYGDAQALWGVDLDVAAGEMVCIVGPNGAGKTTLVKTIAGLHPAAAGSRAWTGWSTALPGHRVCDQAVATVPEGRRVFGHMTVWDNLCSARTARARRGLPHGADRGVRPVSSASGAFRAVGGQPLRRGAADARHWPRPDGASPPPSARRTFARARAGDRRRGIPGARLHRQDRGRDAPGRAGHRARASGPAVDMCL